ncbi:MAG TPA: CinA family protein, partial [Burkholderiaceae bacterium]|nr:CinA family protein [Burkholderiaceae bacterium]
MEKRRWCHGRRSGRSVLYAFGDRDCHEDYVNDASARLLALAQRLGALLQQRRWVLAIAESCTAGGVAYAVTLVPGASAWFER